MAVELGLFNRGKFTFVDCSVHPSDPVAVAQFHHFLANALSDVIVEKWERDLIRKTIRAHYYYFSKEEQEEILNAALTHLTCPEPGEKGLHYKVGRKSRILHRLRDYLDQEQELVVEGFLHFRLQDYLEELEDAVDRAVDDFLLDREHKEFIRLLKYFVEVQDPRVDEVHVLIRTGGSFKLLDRAGAPLRSEVLDEFVADMVESEVNYEDLLISALITLAPRRLTLHGSVQPTWTEGVETIQGVFGERVSLCAHCELCTPAGVGSQAPPPP